MRFTQAYANSAVCTATRVALITARYQYRLAVGLEEPLSTRVPRKLGLPPDHPTLPSVLKEAGYRTALIGKWHFGMPPDFGPLQSGYDRFYGFRSGAVDYFTHKSGPLASDTEDLWDDDVRVSQPGYLTDILGSRAVEAVETYAKSGQPFLISLHFNAPHWPREAPGDEAEAQRLKSLFHYDGGTQRPYQRMIQQMDLQIGRVVKALDVHGVADDTIVVFTSDNGGERYSDTWPFTGRKTELLEGGLRAGNHPLARPYRLRDGFRTGNDQHGLVPDLARQRRRRRSRSSLPLRRDQFAAVADARRGTRSPQAVLALQIQ
jgi:arylsulfatase A-like enzyme